MGVRDGHHLDVTGLEAELFELRGKRLRPAPGHGFGIGGRKAIRHRGDCVGDAGIPQEPALGVLHEIAAVDEVHRLALIETGRPARDVAGGALAAIEHVEFFDTGLFGLREHRMTGQNECSDNDGELDLFDLWHHSFLPCSQVGCLVGCDRGSTPVRSQNSRRPLQCGQVSTSTVTWLRPFSPASRFL